MFKTLVLFILTFLVFTSKCQTLDDPAYSRYSGCREPSVNDDQFVANVQTIIPTSGSKGYLGIIGIVGGGHTYTGKPYFAALSALKVGADVANIFCTNAAGPPIQSMSPDLIVHPFLDTNFEKAFLLMHKMNVILLGPGLDENGHSINVINRVVTLCKTSYKPLILHLDEYFLTQATINLLLHYPSSGVVMITNARQFEKVYPFIKRVGTLSDSRLDINFDNLGNFLIMRTSCTDVAVSAKPSTSWSNSRGDPPLKTIRQNEMISGATATYFYWAFKMLPANYTSANGDMFPAAFATYSASKLVRQVTKMAIDEIGISATTKDIIGNIHLALYGAA